MHHVYLSHDGQEFESDIQLVDADKVLDDPYHVPYHQQAMDIAPKCDGQQNQSYPTEK